MAWVRQTFGSSLGMKYIMAVTGVGLVGFVIAHMLGNLLVFGGPDAVNSYAEMLHHSPRLLWSARIGLIVIFLLHVGSAARLSRENREARPVPYVFKNTVQASYASRTMLASGLLVLLYLAYHLAHFTFRVVDQGDLPAVLVDASGRPDVYRMVVTSFQQPIVSGIYLAATVVLCVHLSHGVSSLFQSLGLNHPRCNPAIRRLGPAVAVIVLAGNCSMPLAALFGILKL